MNKQALTIMVLFMASISFGQSQQKRYYNNSYLQKEVPEGKAKFVQIVTQNADGSETTEVKNIRKDEVVSTETLKGDEPMGVWNSNGINMPGGLDYSFQLIYSDKACADSIAGLSKCFENNEALKYTAPAIAGYGTLAEFIGKNIRYPRVAIEKNAQGKVYLALTISANGQIDNIVVKKGADILLDKEAVRVMRKLKLSSPPLLNGKPVAVCATQPVVFRIE